jgi:hypothetical protein
MHRLVAALISALCLAAAAQTPGTTGSAGGKWGTQWGVLAGEWLGETSTGAGSGRCAFRFELNGNILVRTNHAEVAAGGTRPAAVHDDFMVIYPGKTEGQALANYWDNEGHVIEYSANWSADGSTLTFLSKPGLGPQFRLTYKKLDADTLTVSFEMAPQGQVGAFKPYTSGRIRRQK